MRCDGRFVMGQSCMVDMIALIASSIFLVFTIVVVIMMNVKFHEMEWWKTKVDSMEDEMVWITYSLLQKRECWCTKT